MSRVGSDHGRLACLCRPRSGETRFFHRLDKIAIYTATETATANPSLRLRRTDKVPAIVKVVPS